MAVSSRRWGNPGPTPSVGGPTSWIEAFTVGPRFGSDLAYLLGLVAAGQLDPQIDWRGPWDKVDEAAAALLGRKVRGKAVLEVSP